MPQVLAITTQGHYSETQRAELKADILRQLPGCDVVILILPPGAQLQNSFIPAAIVSLPVALPQTETQGVDDRTVQHVDTDEQDEEPAGILPPHVWLYRNMLTNLQALAPLGLDTTNGQVAVAIDQLTDDQRQIPHVAAQLIPAYAARLEQLRENNTQSDAS